MISEIAALCISLAMHEGIVHQVYEDHLGNRTVGVGHLITQEDEEHSVPLGTYVSNARITELFASDCEKAYRGALRLINDFDSHPLPVQNVLTEMVFQLGVTGVSNFRNMRGAIEDRDYKKAAVEMLDSRWRKQTPNRAEYLAARMASCDC